MSECETGRCPINTNQNRGSSFKLRCAYCGFELPLAFQREHGIICPQCQSGILVWTPNNKVEKGEKYE
jgi:DNA-directed RNA polymerase subunit RPC12/RpoP